ncbi:Carbonic anhydrase or acetyltransferase, isoleucine patch superfamily [Desulfotomaculum arcticum]|uniref:Carbonic anhydrase or acetyltransferase, isoleucine patch superfamily n=1 Tax=Desulfotruncus arcticus DSM 17038 TaxID=1121424 RepID=A0A1I2Z2K1_9FIRM|nr:gamma carbonic anhydrase family protein [Desulfotruncus arcticus]SFH32107.1 Carbonic anhydrase or acetyltransferase, isoleucine patch superfamily [Desulfotomaculum arcticum] [Desulfotruncus arcticus DSM 17038]
MKENQLISYGARTPKLHATVFVAPGAKIIGRVEIGANSSVWYNVVIRGDVDEVTIGAGTNIQDGAVLHQDKGFPLVIGNNVTVGHNAIVHGGIVGDGAVIGMGAIVMSGAKIGANSVLGAGSLLPQGKEIPANSLAMGSPAKVVRQLSEDEVHNFGKMARGYGRRAIFCRGAGDNPDI